MNNSIKVNTEKTVITNDEELEEAFQQYVNLCKNFHEKKKLILNRYGDQDYYDATELISSMKEYALKRGDFPFRYIGVNPAGMYRSPSTAEEGSTTPHYQCFVCGKHDPVINHNQKICGSIELKDADKISGFFTYPQTIEGYGDWWGYMIMACPEHFDQLHYLSRRISATQTITQSVVEKAIAYIPEKKMEVKFQDNPFPEFQDTPEKVFCYDRRLGHFQEKWTTLGCVDSIDPKKHVCLKCGEHTDGDDRGAELRMHIAKNRREDVQKFFKFPQVTRITTFDDVLLVVYGCETHSNLPYELWDLIRKNENYLTKDLIVHVLSEKK